MLLSREAADTVGTVASRSCPCRSVDDSLAAADRAGSDSGPSGRCAARLIRGLTESRLNTELAGASATRAPSADSARP